MSARNGFKAGLELAAAQATPLEPEGCILGAIPTYPIDALPEAARKLVCYGERAGLPPALVGGAALAAAAGAIGAEAEIQITPSWRERANIWVAEIAPRGAGKSPSQDLAFRPLRDHDASLGADGDGEEGCRKSILIGDTTLEALARSLHETGGSATLDADELSMNLRGLNEYKPGGSGNRGRLLALWTGHSWVFERVGAGGKKTNEIKLRIPRPTLVICGGLQPGLHELLGGEEDGLRPRWLPHLAGMPESVGELTVDDAPAEWRQLLEELISHRQAPRMWRFDAGGRRAFQRYRRAWKKQARGVETASTAAALEKADIQLQRVLLTVAEAERPAAGARIRSADLVDKAALLVNFAIDCWRALPEQGTMALTRRDEVLDRSVDRLIAWLEEHGGKANGSDILTAHVAGVRTAEQRNALLERYIATFPGTITTEIPTGGGTATRIVRAPRRMLRVSVP
jgi:hypothetical protein